MKLICQKKELAVLYECDIIITILDNSIYHQQLFESLLRPADIYMQE
jgi:hypothetical protein